MVGAGNICEFHVAAVKNAARTSSWSASTISTRRAPHATAEKLGHDARIDSFDALSPPGANVIHVLTPPSAHVKVALAALEKGCHVLIEKPISEDAGDARAIGELARSQGPDGDASTTRCSTIRRCKRALDDGPRRRARRDRLRRHPARLRLPALRGRPAAAVVPRRGLSVPRPRRALHVPDPGAARSDRGRRGRRGARSAAIRTSRSTSGARMVTLQARPRPVPADVERQADAEPDDHPRHQGRAARRSVRDVPRRKRCVDAAAQGRRAPASTRSPTRSSR